MQRISHPHLRLTLAGLALVALVFTGCTVHSVPGSQGQADKILVCHKGKNTLEVAESALKAHLDHGDTRGPCR